jgi:hypothetical protein
MYLGSVVIAGGGISWPSRILWANVFDVIDKSGA